MRPLSAAEVLDTAVGSVVQFIVKQLASYAYSRYVLFDTVFLLIHKVAADFCLCGWRSEDCEEVVKSSGST